MIRGNPIPPNWGPYRDIPFTDKDALQGGVPFFAVGACQLYIKHVLMALPCFVEHEPERRGWVFVQYGLMEHRLKAHGIEDAGQQLQELLSSLRHNIKFYAIGDRHSLILSIGVVQCQGTLDD